MPRKKEFVTGCVTSNNPEVLNLPLNLPAEKLQTLDAVTKALQGVSNVAAIVLGGSNAHGLARSDSDLDIEQFALRPRDFTTRLAGVLSNPGGDPTELRRSSELLSALWLETVALTAGDYKPRFDLRSVLPDDVA